MRKNKEIKFIEINGVLINVDSITRVSRSGTQTYVGGHGYYDESYESIKKKLEAFTLKD